MLTSTNATLPTLSQEKPVAETKPDVPYAQDEQRHAHGPLRSIGRPNTLAAQHVEVAMVLNAMLGTPAANDYLMRHEVSAQVIDRVLSPTGRRRGNHDASGIAI